METQCTPTFDTSCDTVLQTAYKQECKTIKDVECRIVNLEKYGKYSQKKICTEVPTQKCVPVPVKVEGQKCVNIPTQTCETVPVVASVPVPKKQCFKKPRKVCQTLVTTKPKVVTERIPKTVCGHDQPLKEKVRAKQATKPRQQRIGQGKDELIQESSNFPQKVYFDSEKSQSVNHEEEQIPIYKEFPQYIQNVFPKQKYAKPEEEPQLTYKKEDIPLYEEPSNYISPNDEYEFEKDNYEPEEYNVEPKEEFDYNEYKYKAQAQAEALQNYYKQLNNQLPEEFFNEEQHQQTLDPYYGQLDRNDYDDFANTNPFNNNFYNDVINDDEAFSESRKVESISSDKEKRDANDIIEEYITDSYSIPADVEEISNRARSNLMENVPS